MEKFPFTVITPEGTFRGRFKPDEDDVIEIATELVPTVDLDGTITVREAPIMDHAPNEEDPRGRKEV